MSTTATTTYWGVAVAACLLLPVAGPIARQSGTQVPAPAQPGAPVQAEPAAPPYEERWSQVVESEGEPLVAAGESFVFVVTSRIEALSREDGRSVWLAPLPSRVLPALSDERLFVASGTSLHAVDQGTGKSQWVAELGAEASGVGWHGGLAVAAVASNVQAFRADGTAAWRVDAGAPIVTPFATDGGLLFAGTASPAIVAIDLASGTVRWRLPLPTTPVSLAAHRDRLYFGGKDGALYAYRQHSGDRTDWRFLLTAAVGGLAVDDRLVYCALVDNTVRAFDRVTGNQRWSVSLSTRAAAGPIRSESAVIVPLTTGALDVVDTSGKGASLRRKPEESSKAAPEVVRTKAATSAPDAKTFYLVTVGVDGRQVIRALALK